MFKIYPSKYVVSTYLEGKLLFDDVSSPRSAEIAENNNDNNIWIRKRFNSEGEILGEISFFFLSKI
ncbi:hypothetical protein CAP42_14405 [Acinetobacter indicus]|nr:hypothetical protein VH96_13285 [Acinetobacter indicus]OUY05632.1 hypothetical protein CAP42_14405 [Acinetobacter indicus]